MTFSRLQLVAFIANRAAHVLREAHRARLEWNYATPQACEARVNYWNQRYAQVLRVGRARGLKL